MNTSIINNFILDTLFPVHCLICGKDDEWVCKNCLEKIKLLPFQICPYCERNITPGGKVCSKCKEKLLEKNGSVFLDSLIVASSYKDDILPRLIHFYKYNFVSGLSVPLGEIIMKSCLKNDLPLPDLIIPVPLHPRRLRWRGFNQSELLADYIGKNLAPNYVIPVSSNIICRKRFTKPQMKIKNYQARQENIKNTFYINPNPPRPLAGEDVSLSETGEGLIKNKSILLIDDIATTGSTLLECAKVLKQNSAKKVFGAVIARQEMKF